MQSGSYLQQRIFLVVGKDGESVIFTGSSRGCNVCWGTWYSSQGRKTATLSGKKEATDRIEERWKGKGKLVTSVNKPKILSKIQNDRRRP